MYTIVMQEDKELLTTVKTTIFEKEANVDTLRFLVPPVYDDYDLSTCTALIKYVTPDRKNRAEKLVQQEELYKGYLDYRLDVDTDVTSLPGDVDIRLSFTNDKWFRTLDASGKNQTLYYGKYILLRDYLTTKKMSFANRSLSRTWE